MLLDSLLLINRNEKKKVIYDESEDILLHGDIEMIEKNGAFESKLTIDDNLSHPKSDLQLPVPIL